MKKVRNILFAFGILIVSSCQKEKSSLVVSEPPVENTVAEPSSPLSNENELTGKWCLEKIAVKYQSNCGGPYSYDTLAKMNAVLEFEADSIFKFTGADGIITEGRYTFEEKNNVNVLMLDRSVDFKVDDYSVYVLNSWHKWPIGMNKGFNECVMDNGVFEVRNSGYYNSQKTEGPISPETKIRFLRCSNVF